MKVIYVSGPYTKGDPALNVRAAIDAGERLAAMGYYPVIPHLTHFWHMIHAHPWEFWIDQDLAILERCDALLRLPGESTGADLEVERARQLGKPVYYDFPDLS